MNHLHIKRNPLLYRRLYVAIAIFILIYAILKGIEAYNASLFRAQWDRINILVYGPQTAYYSLDRESGRHYIIYFYPDLKMTVPGGYGEYRVGSLGKLAYLDKNPELLKKTLAVATATFTHGYFYPANEEVYYGKDVKDRPAKPKIREILMSASDMHLLDRIYLALFLLNTKDDDFYLISYQSEKHIQRDDIFFKDKEYLKESIGLLFQKKYRDEGHNIQILYRSKYTVAKKLGQLLEGNGIRVSDISLDLGRNKNCRVIENAEEPSHTAKSIGAYFGCTLEPGKTDVYDNIMILGSDLEKSWEME